MKAEFGDDEELPVEIEGKILDVEIRQVNEKLIKTCPYLSHLVPGSIINFVELDVENLLSEETYLLFKSEINKRKIMRKLLCEEEENYSKYLERKNFSVKND